MQAIDNILFSIDVMLRNMLAAEFDKTLIRSYFSLFVWCSIADSSVYLLVHPKVIYLLFSSFLSVWALEVLLPLS